MKILLMTGGAGFIGLATIEKVVNDFDQIIILDRMDEQVHQNVSAVLTKIETFPNVDIILDDLNNISNYAKRLENVTHVIHLASQTGTAQSMYELDSYYHSNCTSTLSLGKWLIESERVTKIVVASSRSVYGEGAYQKSDGKITNKISTRISCGTIIEIAENGDTVHKLPDNFLSPTNPLSVYASTKLWQENFLSNLADVKNISITILRYQNVYGPGQSLVNPYTGIIGIFTRNILESVETTLFENGTSTRDFVHVEDVAKLNRFAILSARNQSVDIGSGRKVSVREIFSSIANILGVPETCVLKPIARKGDIRHALACVKNIEILANGRFDFIEFSDGLKETVNFNRKVIADLKHENAYSRSMRELSDKRLLK
jgi:dTDP-L-rhamnose 4-epimerase